MKSPESSASTPTAVSAASLTTEDEDVYEINDFTAATEWERFINRLENTIHDFSATIRPTVLSNDELLRASWSTEVKHVKFAERVFLVMLCAVKPVEQKNAGSVAKSADVSHNLLRMNNSFALSSPIERWFGLTEYILVRPERERDVINNESVSNMILSAFNALAGNSKCEIPLFLQVSESSRQIYLGSSWSAHHRTKFATAHLYSVPKRYTYLPGVLELFRDKIKCRASPEPPIHVSVRLSYSLRNEQLDLWPQEPPDVMLGSIPFAAFNQMPFGACLDPVLSLNLLTTWVGVEESVLVENDVYTDLEPGAAPDWRLKVLFAQDVKCLLADSLGQLLDVAKTKNRPFSDFIDVDRRETDPTLALSRLTEDAVPTISSLSKMLGSRGSRKTTGPIPPEDLSRMIDYVFPDANGEKLSVRSTRRESDSDLTTPPETEDSPSIRVKSCPLESLTGRLALVASHVLASVQGVQALCQLWQVVLLELRYRWTEGVLLDGLEPGQPDLTQCELHQELRLLNCCIAAKSQNRKTTEEDDDFYDAPEFFDSAEAAAQREKERTAEGRDKPLKDLTLLARPDTPLFIPLLQPPSPHTERLVQEQSEMFTRLGSSRGSSSLRGKMQSASLFSDMQAFKAANPGCSLADFVRWFSPRDWITEDSGDGHLSDRMTLPGNMWQEAWELAVPIPANKQKPLFDATREAEKLFLLLESKTVAQIAQLVLPVVLHHALELLSTEILEIIPPVKFPKSPASLHFDQAWSRLLRNATSATNGYSFIQEAYHTVITDISTLETSVSRHRALKSRLKELPESAEKTQLLIDLLIGTETHVTPTLKRGVQEIFASSCEESAPGVSQRFPRHSLKEYILVWSAPRPEPFSRPGPQRLYVSVSGTEGYRIALADSSDVTFY